MRAQHYRPRIHSGTITKRRTVPSASTNATRSRSSHRKPENQGQGARALWILMIVGGLIGSGFVMAQQSQINVHQIKQTEEKFRTQLDELTNQQRYLALEKERVINTQESERIAKQSGLAQPKLERTFVPQPPPEPVAKAQLMAKQIAKTMLRPTAKASAKSIIKPAAQLKLSAKQPTIKSVSKLAPPSKASNAGKAGKNQPVLAHKQDSKKEKRH